MMTSSSSSSSSSITTSSFDALPFAFFGGGVRSRSTAGAFLGVGFAVTTRRGVGAAVARAWLFAGAATGVGAVFLAGALVLVLFRGLKTWASAGRALTARNTPAINASSQRGPDTLHIVPSAHDGIHVPIP